MVSLIRCLIVVGTFEFTPQLGFCPSFNLEFIDCLSANSPRGGTNRDTKTTIPSWTVLAVTRTRVQQKSVCLFINKSIIHGVNPHIATTGYN